jgi:RimJ/RimL family protein N-acetyltransferase
MNLRVIERHEDKTNEAYNSSECQQLLEAYEDFYPKIGFDLPWVGYFVMRDEKIVGSCGFVGRPKDGVVEIAYWTFKEFEGQGIASFACQELVSIAHKADQSVRVTAKTAPENNASTKILEKNGFVFKEIVQDHEIGDAWLWIRK